ncbi:MAG: flagellar hook-associated protein FlgL, partial [Gemmatimonadota bacterium]|nr:flagellar hook-associated protein FlgL [Gemmatimonadota bacterium]
MSFRVTQNLLSNTVLSNLNRNIEALMKTQSSLSSGKRLEKPSDDPVGTSSAMRLRTYLSETKQHLRNMDSGETQLNSTDHSLDDMSKLIMRAQELAIGQANSTADYRTRTAVAEEIDGIINQLVDILNVRVGDRYIFAGYDSLERPFLQSKNGIEYLGDSGQLKIEIETGTTLNNSIPGSLLLPTAVVDLGGQANLGPYVEREIPFTARSLLEMNQGTGVDDGYIKITNRGGRVGFVDMTGTKTLEEAALRISNAVDDTGNKLRLNAYIDSQAHALVVEENVLSQDRVAGQRFSIEEVGLGRTARQLGIRQTDRQNTGKITGRDLMPLSLTTRLEDLRRGNGIELGSFQITDRDGNSAIIDIRNAETLEDVRGLINQAGTNLQASINIYGNGLILADSSGLDAQYTIQVTEVGTNTHTAEELGLLTPPGGIASNTLPGKSLDPQLTSKTPVSLLNRAQGFDLDAIQVENGPLKGTIDLSRCSTVGQIIDKFNTAGLSLSAKINDMGTGISVTSLVGGRTLKISNAPGSLTALQLGIEGMHDIQVDPVVPRGQKGELQPAIDGSTRLNDINSGEGFTPGVIRITDSTGDAINLNITGVNTIQGVMNLINSVGANGEGNVNVVAELAPDRQSIQLVDLSIQNTKIEKVTDTGTLISDFFDLDLGKTVIINSFRGDDQEIIARSVDIVNRTNPGEETLAGVIQTVDKYEGTISLRTVEGELYQIKCLQPIQNLFSGQSIFLNGETLQTGAPLELTGL